MRLSSDEIDNLIQSGQIKEYEDGSLRWQSDNSHDKQPGALVTRPPDAMEPWTAQTASMVRREQIARDRLSQQRALVKVIAERYDLDPENVTLEEAREIAAEALYEMILREKKLKDRLSGERFLDERLGLNEKPAPLVDQRQQTIQVSSAQAEFLRGNQTAQELINRRSSNNGN